MIAGGAVDSARQRGAAAGGGSICGHRARGTSPAGRGRATAQGTGVDCANVSAPVIAGVAGNSADRPSACRHTVSACRRRTGRSRRARHTGAAGAPRVRSSDTARAGAARACHTACTRAAAATHATDATRADRAADAGDAARSGPAGGACGPACTGGSASHATSAQASTPRALATRTSYAGIRACLSAAPQPAVASRTNRAACAHAAVDTSPAPAGGSDIGAKIETAPIFAPVVTAAATGHRRKENQI